MENTYKREYGEMDDATKQKISQRLKNRCKSTTHKQNISQGMKQYWAGVPSKYTPQNADKQKSRE